MRPILVALLLLLVALSGCVSGIETFTILVRNHTQDPAEVAFWLVDLTHGRIVFQERLELGPGALQKFDDEIPPVDASRADPYRLYAARDGSPSTWTRVYDLCGSCIEEIHIEPDRIRFANSVLD